jgi:hypothetical protein
MLSRAQIDDICARNPIPDIVESYGGTLRRGTGACVICGGSKRSSRFEATDGGRGWVCAVCQDGGDVIDLVMRVERLGFNATVERLGGALAFSPKEAARRERVLATKRVQREAEAATYRERERRRCKAIWCGSLAALDSPIETYLNAREIFDVASMRVRYSPEQPYFDGKRVIDEAEAAALGEPRRAGKETPRLIYTGPAMLAPIVGLTGRFEGLHITWIDPACSGEKAKLFDPESGEALPAKKMRGCKAGGFLDVFPGGDPARVYIGEGIESVASVREERRDGAVYRVAGDLGNLAGPAVATLPHPTARDEGGRPRRVPGPQPKFESEACPIPELCVDLMLLKDGDSDPFLTDLAMLRAAARHRCAGRRIAVADPGEGVDFNDLARAP